MLTKKAKLFFNFRLRSANSIYLSSQIKVNGWFAKRAWNPEQTSNTVLGDFCMPSYFDCASILSCNQWSISCVSYTWSIHVQVHLTCLVFSLCQDNNSYSLASASSRPWFWPIGTVRWVRVCMFLQNHWFLDGLWSLLRWVQTAGGNFVLASKVLCNTGLDCPMVMPWRAPSLDERVGEEIACESTAREADFSNQLSWTPAEQQMHWGQSHS